MSELYESEITENLYITKLKGNFKGLLCWSEFDTFWNSLRMQRNNNGYIYKIGDASPETAASPGQFMAFINKTKDFIRENHKEKYCDVVYVDDINNPAFVKIFHPKNLGHGICSIYKFTPLPGWIISTVRPVDLAPAQEPNDQLKWWNKIMQAF